MAHTPTIIEQLFVETDVHNYTPHQVFRSVNAEPLFMNLETPFR